MCVFYINVHTQNLKVKHHIILKLIWWTRLIYCRKLSMPDVSQLLRNFFHNKSTYLFQMRGCEMLNIPSISDIYRSTIVSLLKAKKYHQCEVLCERVLSCQPTSVLDLSSILSQHSQEPAHSQETSTQARACMGSFAFGNRSFQETSMEECKVSCSQGKRKRLASSEEKSDPRNEGQTEMVFVHLYKAEAQVCLNKIEEAIESLDM